VIDEFAEWAADDLAAYPCLSTGIDSNVYRIGDYVAKEYQRMSLAEVERYVALQNGAAEFLRRSPYHATIQLRGVEIELVARSVVPVAWVGQSRSDKPLTFSPFVEATNLEKLLWRPEMFNAFADAQLTNPDLRNFAADLNAFFWSEYPTRCQDELHYHVCMLSRLLDRELGVSGLYISKYNVKLQPTAPGRLDLIVTDLALYIERVTCETESTNQEQGHAG
jgi:hypothetical protein